jgi:hypothetical protein
MNAVSVHCGRCGTELAGGAKACSACGAHLTTAGEYLAYLQAIDPIGGGNLASEREWMRARTSQLQSAGLKRHQQRLLDNWGNIGKLLNQWASDYIVEPFKQTLPTSVRASLDAVPWALVGLRSLNAHAARAPSGEPFLTVNLGLLHMASFYMETKVTMAAIAERGGVERAQEYQLAAYSLILEHFETGGATRFPPPGVPLPEQAMLAATAYAVAMETFVFAHEFAHVIAGHLERGATRRAFIGGTESAAVDFFQLSHTQELEADRIAWTWYQSGWEELPIVSGLSSSLGRGAPLWFFVLLHLVEQNIQVQDQYSTHPPAIARLLPLVKSFQESGRQDDLALADDILAITLTVPKLRRQSSQAT